MSTLLERMADKFTVGDRCWQWTGSTTGVGYGAIFKDGKMRGAHRVMFELFVGPIPEGLDLDHLCRNRSCVRPDHLEPVTRSENLRRGDVGGHAQRARTRCPEGHLYDRVGQGKTGRYCQCCKLAKQRARRRNLR